MLPGLPPRDDIPELFSNTEEEKRWVCSRVPFGVLSLESEGEFVSNIVEGREEGGLGTALGGIGGGAGNDWVRGEITGGEMFMMLARSPLATRRCVGRSKSSYDKLLKWLLMLLLGVCENSEYPESRRS